MNKDDPVSLRERFAFASLPPGWTDLQLTSGGLPVPAYFIPAKNAKATVVAVNGLHSSPFYNANSYKLFTENNINVIGIGLIPLASHERYVEINQAMVDEILLSETSPIFQAAPDTPHILMTHSTSGLLGLDALADPEKAATAQTLYKGVLHLNPFLEARRASPKYHPFSSKLHQIYAHAQKNRPILEHWIERLVMETKDHKITDADKNFCYGQPLHGHITALQKLGRQLSRAARHKPAGVSVYPQDFDQKILLSYSDNKVCNQTVHEFARAHDIPVEIHAGRHSTLLADPRSIDDIFSFINKYAKIPPLPAALTPTYREAANMNDKPKRKSFFSGWFKKSSPSPDNLAA